MRSFFNNSKNLLGTSLTLILITALINNFSVNTLTLPFVTVASAILFDFLFLKIRRIKPFFPSAAIVTGLIIGLVSPLESPIYVPIAACFIAIFSKNFLRFTGKHIFNPAGLGVLLSAIIFSASVSWWGVSWQILSADPLAILYFLILLSPAIVSVWRMKRHRIIVSFLATYTLVLVFLLGTPLTIFLDPTLIFFSLVMLPEPMTTPNKNIRQIAFGVFVALVVSLFSLPFTSGLPFSSNLDPLILALLLGNILFFKFR